MTILWDIITNNYNGYYAHLARDLGFTPQYLNIKVLGKRYPALPLCRFISCLLVMQNMHKNIDDETTKKMINYHQFKR